MYIADTDNHRVRKVTVSTGIITTMAGSSTSGIYSGDGGPATSASLYTPFGVALDSSGTTHILVHLVHLVHLVYLTIGNVYIADYYNYRIRKVTASTGIITTFAGGNSYGYSGDNGLATSAKLNTPWDVAVDASGSIEVFTSLATSFFTIIVDIDNVYIADYSNCNVRKVTASTGIITTIAGTGAASYSGDGGDPTLAALNFPRGMAIDVSGKIRNMHRYIFRDLFYFRFIR